MADLTALSGITGSISIASWVVVFSPQIVENFRRSSAEGLSIVFVVIWLAGDVFNIAGAVLQGVLPTMIILAVYYTLADIVLLLQCWYYRGFTLKDPSPSPIDTSATTGADSEFPAPSNSNPSSESTHPSQPQLKPNNSSSSAPSPPTERTALLTNQQHDGNNATPSPLANGHGHHRRSSFKDHLQPFQSNDAPRFSPAQPMHRPSRDEAALKAQSPVQRRRPLLQSILFNAASILVVCAAGVLGWWLSTRTSSHPHPHHGRHHGIGETKQRPDLHFNLLGQVFGYICAVLYLGSRLPQLLLNYRRKSTDGLSLLFFLFACIGNATYVLSILAYEPVCERRYAGASGIGVAGDDIVGFSGSSTGMSGLGEIWGARYCSSSEARAQYARNLAVNASWLIGSFGTLLLDAGVFVQYFIYRRKEGESAVVDVDEHEREEER